MSDFDFVTKAEKWIQWFLQGGLPIQSEDFLLRDLDGFECFQVDLKALVRRSDEAAVRRWLQCVASKSVHEFLWPGLYES